MAKYIRFADEWAKKILNSKHKHYTLNSIVRDINYLVYATTKEPLGYPEKAIILNRIFDFISQRERLFCDENNQLSSEFFELIFFLERKEAALSQLKADIKQQALLN